MAPKLPASKADHAHHPAAAKASPGLAEIGGAPALIKHHHCIACHGTRVTPKYAGNFVGDANNAHEYFLSGRKYTAHGDIWSCSDCGFEFTSPQFTRDQYNGIYSRSTLNPAGIDLSAANRKRFNGIAQWIGQSTVVDRAEHLDFGCGDGQLLQAVDSARPMGFDVVLPSKRWERARYQSGHLPTELALGALASERFSLITAIDVFEHLADLDDHIAALRQLLSPQGRLVFSVPDASSLTAQMMGAGWSMILLEHLWYFTPKAVRAIAARHRLTLERTSAVRYYTPAAHLVKRLTGRAAPDSVKGICVPVPAGISIFQLCAR
jgi:2-polyprenyl-3-methyl-5-hydroxy-6-metoxy-1,4-benzoquinol methylase